MSLWCGRQRDCRVVDLVCLLLQPLICITWNMPQQLSGSRSPWSFKLQEHTFVQCSTVLQTGVKSRGLAHLFHGDRLAANKKRVFCGLLATRCKIFIQASKPTMRIMEKTWLLRPGHHICRSSPTGVKTVALACKQSEVGTCNPLTRARDPVTALQFFDYKAETDCYSSVRLVS